VFLSETAWFEELQSSKPAFLSPAYDLLVYIEQIVRRSVAASMSKVHSHYAYSSTYRRRLLISSTPP
jgi:hypothetical protein